MKVVDAKIRLAEAGRVGLKALVFRTKRAHPGRDPPVYRLAGGSCEPQSCGTMSAPTTKWLIIGTFVLLFAAAVLLLSRILNPGINPSDRINMPRRTNWIKLLVVVALVVLSFLAAMYFIVLSKLS
jgi:hypothetical protein